MEKLLFELRKMSKSLRSSCIGCFCPDRISYPIGRPGTWFPKVARCNEVIYIFVSEAYPGRKRKSLLSAGALDILSSSTKSKRLFWNSKY